MFKQNRFIQWFLTGAIAWLTFSPSSRPRRVLRKQLIFVKNFILARPALKRKIVKILNNFPKLKYRLKKLNMPQSESGLEKPIGDSSSPRVKKIYKELLLLQKKGSV